MEGYGVRTATVIWDRMTMLIGHGCCVKGWHPSRNHVRPLPQMILGHFSLLLHKVWQGSKTISLGCPKYTPKQ